MNKRKYPYSEISQPKQVTFAEWPATCAACKCRFGTREKYVAVVTQVGQFRLDDEVEAYCMRPECQAKIPQRSTP